MLLQLNAEQLDARERSEVMGLLPSLSEKTVLDLGAGIGRFTAEFAKTAKKVVAVDLCPHFINANKKANIAHQNIDWISADALDADFPAQHFDLIFIWSVLMYLPDRDIQTLSKKLNLWLKPKGHMFFVESCAAATHFSPIENYYAHYRSPLVYDKLFKNWELVARGNIQAYEDLVADPFKCYWTLSKS